MNKITLIILTISLSINNGNSQIVWTQKADFPGEARSACVAFSIGEYGYVGAGYDGVGYRRSFYKYEPVFNSWIQIASMGGDAGGGLERNVAAVFTVNGIAYIGTGQGGAAFLNDLWQYDPSVDVWTQRADFPGSARRSAIGFAVDNFGYVGLGQSADGFEKDVWKFNPASNTWLAVEDFPGTPRRLPVAFTIGSKAYVGTGDDGTFKRDFYEYIAAADNWAPIASFPGTPRYGATAFSMNEKGYILTGYDSTLQNTDDFWEYDPITDAWAAKDNFPGSKRENAISFSIDTNGYAGLGYDTIRHTDFWKYGDTTTPPVIIGIDDQITTLFSYSLYPNPVSDYAIITISGINANDAIFRIYDLTGKEVSGKLLVISILDVHNETTIHFNCSNLMSGNYVFVVSSGQKMVKGKFTTI